MPQNIRYVVRNFAKYMKEIGQKCGMQSKAQGVVMSLPVDGIVGLD